MERALRTLASQIVNARERHYGVFLYKFGFHTFVRRSTEEILVSSLHRLRRILRHAHDTSPYYHTLWRSIGIHPDSLKLPEDIHRLPYLTKDLIEKHKHRIISNRSRSDNLEKSHTGGSSGTPTSFFRDRRCTSMRIGRQRGILDWYGYSVGDRCGLVWGAQSDLDGAPGKVSFKKRFTKFASGTETLECTTLDAWKMTDFHRRLQHFRPEILYGYPSALAQFAEFLKENHLPLLTVRAIFCTAERLTDEHRTLLQETFGGEVFNLYCTREHGCIAFECNRHKGFHIDTGSVHLEIIHDRGPLDMGQPGEIVITDLLNYGMPFIRNRIGDRGVLSPDPCDCGCPLPLLHSLEGRVSDVLYRPDGSTVTGLMLTDIRDHPTIKEVQIIQEELSEISVLMVVSDGFGPGDTEAPIRDMKRHLGEQVNIRVRIVPEIPRNPHSGKVQEVICRIRPNPPVHHRRVMTSSAL